MSVYFPPPLLAVTPAIVPQLTPPPENPAAKTAIDQANGCFDGIIEANEAMRQRAENEAEGVAK